MLLYGWLWKSWTIFPVTFPNGRNFRKKLSSYCYVTSNDNLECFFLDVKRFFIYYKDPSLCTFSGLGTGTVASNN